MYSSSKPLIDALTSRVRGANRKTGAPGEVGWGLVPDDKGQYMDVRCENVKVSHRADEFIELVIEV
jgi:hypothetical protein